MLVFAKKTVSVTLQLLQAFGKRDTPQAHPNHNMLCLLISAKFDKIAFSWDNEGVSTSGVPVGLLWM